MQQSQPPANEAVASATPAHLILSSVSNFPANSLLVGTHLLQAYPAGIPVQPIAFLDTVGGTNAGLGVGEVLLEDVSKPTQGVPVVPQAATAPSRWSSSFQPETQTQHPLGWTTTPDLSSKMVEKLTLLGQIINSAQKAKNALLRGQWTELSTNLGHLINQLEMARELGVGPVLTLSNMTPAASTNVSPVSHQAPHTVATVAGATAAIPMAIVPSQAAVQPATTHPAAGVTPAVSVEAARSTPKLNAGLAIPQLMPAAQLFPGSVSQAPAPPALHHSDSFANDHQLPSQIHGHIQQTTPGVASPHFAAFVGIRHVPHVSSPPASIPPSRPAFLPCLSASQSIHGLNPWARVPVARGGSDGTPIYRTSEGSVRPDCRPMITRGRSTSITKPRGPVPTMTSSMPPSAWHPRQGSPEDEDDNESEDEAPRRTKRRSGEGNEAPDLGSTSAFTSDNIRRQLDQIFEEFLNRVCSDLEIRDSKGEKLHQVLMPRKMQRLGQSTEYRPFKFRIQAFSNGFHEELQARGIIEDTMSSKKVKAYLWRQDLITRFNSDGKKAKTKGNHIWNVDAKKLPGGGWVFRPFKRRIIGQPNEFALVGKEYEWEPRIWDPQAASDMIKPTFRSLRGALPAWLKWEDGIRLVGVPDQPTGPIPITAIGEFADGSGSKCTLYTTFTIQAVVPSLITLDDP